MEKFKDFRKSGSFRLSSGIEVPGELSLKGGATSLDLYSSAFFDTHAREDIAGTFHDRSKVSLIGCITRLTQRPMWGWEMMAKVRRRRVSATRVGTDKGRTPGVQWLSCKPLQPDLYCAVRV